MPSFEGADAFQSPLGVGEVLVNGEIFGRENYGAGGGPWRSAFRLEILSGKMTAAPGDLGQASDRRLQRSRRNHANRRDGTVAAHSPTIDASGL
jgi:hypothetical protein